MYETMAIDSRTIIVKSDNERELSEIMEFISMGDKKEENVKAFLNFAANKRKVVKNYKFNREECYVR
jgi:hypothetical protein